MVKAGLSASPSRDGMTGMLLGSSGSVPKNASTTSANPSPSLSAREAGFTTVKRLAGVIVAFDVPAILVAASAKVPAIPAGTETVSVADVPVGSIELLFTTMAGEDAGRKEKVEPVRVVPVTWKVICVPANADFRLSEMITGTGTTVMVPTCVMPRATGVAGAETPFRSDPSG